ncbi:periodic tryptophan protein 2-like [Tropilaelaps mercedesae]|uniref:Periodic tryptophan protein 2-like n=1 Tax=Tropilaelaps mercedesae TaxID=418985 RepID=A0A1V9XNP8_9ACAR|nr:periodic tryptophan protein 2-like [Tropilaelaps mercedesae]
MKFNYKFSNLLGTVYRKGNVLFTNDGNTVISPVGNRITLFDLRNSKANTLPVEADHNFVTLALSPSGTLLIAVTEHGECYMISLASRTVIHRRNFMRPIRAVKFSPDGRHFAMTKENKIFIFKTPGRATGAFEAFIIERVYSCFVDDTTCVDWSSDSRFVVVGSRDMTVKVIAVVKIKHFKLNTFTSHSDELVGVFFAENSLDCFTVARNNVLCTWQASVELADIEEDDGAEAMDENDSDNEGGKDFFYRREGKHFLKDTIKAEEIVSVMSACYNSKTKHMAVGFSNGAFTLLELPEFIIIQSLSLEGYDISAVEFNLTGDWLALASSSRGQLVVYEWQSEGFVLKQQGHTNNMTCLDYSPSGQYVVTGGDDGKVKLWNLSTGFCFVTFSEHTSGISAVKFTQNGKAVLSASYDGTVRATDVKRYRNFKTFTSPEPTQFISLCVDSSGEVVCAGSQDTFEVFVWSMQTGRLVEVLAGHTAPVSGIVFSPIAPLLISSSWDKTCKVWQMFTSKGTRETIQLGADCLAVEVRPDGREFAVSTLDGCITMFDVDTAAQVHCIEGRYDLHTGRREGDLVTAKRLQKVQAFTTLCYTADGECVLAAGRSKVICIYHVGEQVLLRRFEITCNLSLDGLNDMFDRKKMSEFGNLNLVEERDDDPTMLVKMNLPGSKKLDNSTRTYRPEVRVAAVRFSPTGRAFSAVSTEGLLSYSLDASLAFDPYDLEMDITSDKVRDTASAGNWSEALMLAFRLNEKDVLREVFEAVPISNAELVASQLPQVYVEKLLSFLAAGLESTSKIELYMRWVHTTLMTHGESLKDRSPRVVALLKALQKSITLRQRDLYRVCEKTRHAIRYVVEVNAKSKTVQTKGDEMEDSEDDILNEKEPEMEECNLGGGDVEDGTSVGTAA